MNNSELQKKIDDLGRLLAKKNEIEKQEQEAKAEIKKELKTRKLKVYDGKLFRFTMVKAVQRRLKSEKVKQFLKDQGKQLRWFQTTTHTTSVRLTSLNPTNKGAK